MHCDGNLGPRRLDLVLLLVLALVSEAKVTTACNDSSQFMTIVTQLFCLWSSRLNSSGTT
jgi:hypothetical protein